MNSFICRTNDKSDAEAANVFELSRINYQIDAAAQREISKLRRISDQTDAAVQREVLKLSRRSEKPIQLRNEIFLN